MGHWALNQLKNGTSSTDFNDYVESGFYELFGSSTAPMSNAPISSSNTSNSSGNWYLQVLRRDSSYITQVAYSVRTDTAIAIRSYNNGTWGNWRLINEWGGNLMMAPPKARGNSSTTAYTRYYKIATCQINNKWQDCYARMEFFDYNHVNVNERGCGIDICARVTVDTGVITIDGSLLYGDDSYLNKIYAVYTPTGTTYPKTVDLYLFCNNLKYQEIAVKIFYTRSRTGENIFTWDYSDSNSYIEELPEGSTAVLLSDVITRTTLAADALTLNGVAASNYARLASPAFTGTPTAPTPSTSDDSTKIATTAWVHNQNYLTTIPSASQAVLGGVKVYTDSSGYRCIDTE